MTASSPTPTAMASVTTMTVTAATTAARSASGAILGRLAKFRRHLGLFYGAAQQVFDRPEFILLFFADKSKRDAIGLRARGTADPMDIILPIVWYIVVDDHLDIVDVDTTGEDVGCDQDGQTAALLNSHQDIFPASLVKVGMDLFYIENGIVSIPWSIA